MTRKKNINPLIKSSIVYLVATAIGQGITFLGIPVFTRLMNQMDYGKYSTYYAFVSLFTVLIGANLYYSLNNAYIDKKDVVHELNKSVLFLSTLIMGAILIIALTVRTLIGRSIPLFIIIFAIIHSYGFFVITYRMYAANMENDYKKKMWLLIMPNLLQFVMAVGVLFLFPDASFEARIVGSTLGIGIIALIVYVEIMGYEGRVINIAHWKYALSIALPTVMMSLSYMLMQQSDKVMITRICGAEFTAIYSTIFYLGYIIIAIDQAVAPVRQAWVFRKILVSDMLVARLIQKWYLLVMATIATCIMMVAPEVIKLILPENYWDMKYIVPFIISACFMMLYRFYVEIILFYKKNVLLSVCVFICAIVNIILNLIFLPMYGAIAACYTTVFAYGLLFFLMWRVAKRYSWKVYSMSAFIMFIVWLVMISVFFGILCDLIFLRFLCMGIVLLIMCVYILKMKKELKGIMWEEYK